MQPVITLQKIKYVLPSLKPSIGKDIKSRVVYKVTCPGCQTCYVGQTSRHLRTRLAEHKNRKDQPVRIHFDECVSDVPTLKDVDILHSTFRNLTYLLTLEALYIKELKPSLNTKDEYRSRTLTLQFT